MPNMRVIVYIICCVLDRENQSMLITYVFN